MTKMTRKHLINMLGEDDAAFMQGFKTQILLLMATDKLDTTQLAQGEMANRGLGANGEWIGFPAAAKLWAAPANDSPLEIEDDHLEALARIHMGIETLKERRMDALDFHEVGVLQLKDALRAAFELGRASK
ncbi:MAG: hypothetical protein Q8O14_14615 [bacterium]|nr:hypothetical protein [bacterium]